MAATLAPVFPFNQAQTPLPWKALSVLTENLRVGVREGPGKWTPGIEPIWSHQRCPVLLPTTRVIYPCQVPLDRLTHGGIARSLLQAARRIRAQACSQTLQSWYWVLPLPTVWPLGRLLYLTCQIYFIFCE